MTTAISPSIVLDMPPNTSHSIILDIVSEILISLQSLAEGNIYLQKVPPQSLEESQR
jgi:hypothetical protein